MTMIMAGCVLVLSCCANIAERQFRGDTQRETELATVEIVGGLVAYGTFKKLTH